MTYKETYHNYAYGERADYAAVEDTGDPYQNLANGIVAQAGVDYRNALTYLAAHPKAPRFEEYMTREQVQIMAAPIRYTRHEKLFVMRHRVKYRDEARWEMGYALWWRMEQQRRVRKTPEYRRYARAEYNWVMYTDLKADCETFWRSSWATMLTNLDPMELKKKISIEVVLNVIEPADIARRIEAECFKQHRSVASMLKEAQLQDSTVYYMKSGRAKVGPSAYSIGRICSVLGKDPNWLLGWEDS